MRQKRGFTIIELMVVMVIGMVVTGAGLMYVNDFNEKQKVEAVREDLVANLRMARTLASTEQFPGGIVDDNNPDTKVVMAVLMNGKNVEIRARDGISFDYQMVSKKIVTDNINVNFGVGTSVAFSISDGRSVDGAKTITVSGDDISRDIKIDELGLIYEQ